MSAYHISIDLGTTTLAFADSLGNHFTSYNHQSSFGADVISRIKASCDGHAALLKEIMEKDLTEGIERMKSLSGLNESAAFSVTIAANTTMTHLLMGYSCDGLSSFPFSPVTLEEINIPAEDSFIGQPVTLLPGASAFIGGDVLSGLLFLQADTWEEPCLLLDLGTNGEMVLGTKDKLFAASAAAGPAFEGGGISCGIGGIKGAICHYSMDKTPAFQTISYGRPVGICGTGIIDITAELLSHGKMDETGLLSEPYFTEGFPVTPAYGSQKPLTLTQSDIREIQMAKSAVCTGIELLCKQSGVSFSEIDRLFLAGTLGTQVSIENAARIGLFPPVLADKIQPCGNTSLKGAGTYASLPSVSQNKIKKIRNSISCLELANLTEFQKRYITNLNFTEPPV